MQTALLSKTVGRLAAAIGILATLLVLNGAGTAGAQFAADPDPFISFVSVNVPEHYIRHRNFLGELTPVNSDPDRRDATFTRRPALNGRADAVSFESTNVPGHFLRHQDFRIKISPNDGSDLFRQDASFFVRPGWSGHPEARSYEAVNAPGHFIRHANFELWLAPSDDTDLFRLDASFYEYFGSLAEEGRSRHSLTWEGRSQPLAVGRRASFESVNIPGRYIRHRLFLGELSPLVTQSGQSSDSQIRQDGTFIVHPALSGTPGAWSFEAVNVPGHFLRHSGYRIMISPDDGSDLFRQDASFVERPGLSGTPGTLSLEAVNYPGHFIRHQGNELWLARSDWGDTARFPYDASFRPMGDLRPPHLH